MSDFRAHLEEAGRRIDALAAGTDADSVTALRMACSRALGRAAGRAPTEALGTYANQLALDFVADDFTKSARLFCELPAERVIVVGGKLAPLPSLPPAYCLLVGRPVARFERLAEEFERAAGRTCREVLGVPERPTGRFDLVEVLAAHGDYASGSFIGLFLPAAVPGAIDQDAGRGPFRSVLLASFISRRFRAVTWPLVKRHATGAFRNRIGQLASSPDLDLAAGAWVWWHEWAHWQGHLPYAPQPSLKTAIDDLYAPLEELRVDLTAAVALDGLATTAGRAARDGIDLLLAERIFRYPATPPRPDASTEADADATCGRLLMSLLEREGALRRMRSRVSLTDRTDRVLRSALDRLQDLERRARASPQPTQLLARSATTAATTISVWPALSRTLASVNRRSVSGRHASNSDLGPSSGG